MTIHLGVHEVVSVSMKTAKGETGHTWTSLIALTDAGEKIEVTLHHCAEPLEVQIQANEALRVELT